MKGEMIQFEVKIDDLELTVYANVEENDYDFSGMNDEVHSFGEDLEIEIVEIYDASMEPQNLIDLTDPDMLDKIEEEICLQWERSEHIDIEPDDFNDFLEVL